MHLEHFVCGMLILLVGVVILKQFLLVPLLCEAKCYWSYKEMWGVGASIGGHTMSTPIECPFFVNLIV